MKENKREIELNFDFLRQAKKKTIHTLMSYGKEHPVLKYPMFAVTVVFIFIYNMFLHLFIQLHVREKLARGLAFAMSVILVLTSIDITAFAMSGLSEGEEAFVITGFGELNEDILLQKLAVGETEDKIQFPDTLSVTIVTEENSGTEESEEKEETASPTPEMSPTPTAEVEETPDAQESATPETGETPGTEETPDSEERETPGSEETSGAEDNQGSGESNDSESGETTDTDESGDSEPEEQGGETPEETPNEPAPQQENEGEAEENLVARVADFLFPAMTVYAAEETPFIEETEISESEIAVSWILDADRSSREAFSSEQEGDAFVYVPVLPDGYCIAEDVPVPEIWVVITEAGQTITSTDILLESPKENEHPVMEYADPEGQFLAEITWSFENAILAEEDVFEADNSYTAELLLSPEEGYTLSGLTSDAFSVTDETGKEYEAVYDEENQIVTVTFDPVEKEQVAFEESVEIDGIVITVKAEEGIFPKDATLHVTRIEDGDQLLALERAADEADGIDTQKDDDASVDEGFYAFDITILDKEVREIQPDEEKGSVTVSFSNPDPEQFSTSDLSVYHMDESTGEAENLNAQADESEEKVEAKTSSFSPFILRAAANEITLYTGGGTLFEDGWSKSAEGKYVSTGNVISFPTPEMKDATLQFAGWYSDKNYSNKATSPAGGMTYYAKWNRTSGSATGSTMEYSYTYSGIDAHGIKDGKTIQTTFFNNGYVAYYKLNDANASGSGTQISSVSSGDPFVQINGDLYVAQVATFMGPYVCFSYYVWNRGTSDVQNFNLGAAADVQIGYNDSAALSIGSDEAGNYVTMTDGTNEMRLYYTGSLVTPTDTLWTGRYSQHRSNVFNNNPGNCNNMDSTLAFSWKNISIPANGVVVKSVLLGCGEAGSLSLQRYFACDKNGNDIIEDDEKQIIDDDTVIYAPDAPSKDGYVFLGWNTARNGSGRTYQPGDVISVEEDMTLYALWRPIENTTQIYLTLDGSAWAGQTVQLYSGGSAKYTLTEKAGASGTYVNDKVINGTYDIYVNGRKSDKSLTLAAIKTSLTVKETVVYNALHITTRLDDENSAKPGTVTLRKGSTVVYTPVMVEEGVYSENILASESSYDIFVDGNDTDADISPSDPVESIDFYTVTVKITDDEPWLDANVTLRDSMGNLRAVLAAGEISDNTVTYTKIMQKKPMDILSVYVDGQYSHKTLQSMPNQCLTELAYYTATANILGDIPLPRITMTNGTESYTFTQIETGDTGKVYVAEHVLIHNGNDGGEISYSVTVENTIDAQEIIVNSENKEVTLTYWTVEFYNCATETDPFLIRIVYVRDDSIMPKYTGNVKTNGYTFAFWSETPWPGETENGEFDFSSPITRNIKLYANYSTPTVTIGDIVKTDENGNISGSGLYYRMANLTISGFDPGEDAIKYIFLTTVNTTSIKILDTSNMKLENGSSEVMVDGSAVTLTPSSDKVAITFTKAISMAKAQDFLRNQIVVQPALGMEHQMEVEVDDKSGEYVAANAVTATKTTASATELTGYTGVYSLSGGIYYLTKDATYNGYHAGRNGLSIASGTTVYIYIPQGVTLTAYGGAGSGKTGGGAGIYVPSNSTLVILGEGKVIATGGNAGSGTDGTGGGNAYASGSSGYYYGGSGGAGGAGGGGAGAGIGGNGGTGGAGASSRSSNGTLYSGNNNYCGNDGYTGSPGGSGSTCGTVYILGSIEITAKGGGNGSSGGSGGNAGSNDWSTVKWDGKDNHTAGGGGGGGGGGAGYTAAAIGGGGAAGGGGGSGGSGGVDYSEKSFSTSATNDMCGAAGGNGGSGYHPGSTGGGNRDSGVGSNGKWNQTGGTGGSGGSSGSSGGNGTVYKAKTATVNGSKGTSTATKYQSYTISFNTTTTTATKPASCTYNFGQSYTFTLPEYNDSNPDVVFLGWQLQVYAGSGVEGSPLTTAGMRYPAGKTFTLDPSTYGNITFVAVTETVGGIRDDDNTGATYNQNDPEVTYYTYKVTVKVDGNTDTSKGKIKIGDKTVAPGADDSYTLIDTKEEKKAIYIGGALVGYTSDFGVFDNIFGYESDTEINYETLQVTVEGKEPRSVTLTGDGAPSLIDNGDNTFTYEQLKGASSGSFDILVDGEATGKTVTFGTPTTVNFHTVTVRVNANGIAEDGITSVELRDEAGQSLFLTKQEDGTFAITGLEDTKSYTVYVNGEATDKTADFSKDQTVELSFNRYTTVVKTQLDGALCDMGTVRLGDTKMVRTGIGTYQLTTQDNTSSAISVDGREVRSSVTPGEASPIVIDYYTLTYDKSGEAGDRETGELPEDHTWYLSGTEAKLLDNVSLTNGGRTFAGWRIGNTVYPPGQTVTVSETMVAKAVWKVTSLETASEHFDIALSSTEFMYDGQSKLPEITVTRNGTALSEGTDYAVTYENTNKDAGRNDNNGGSLNAVNAGTVTVTVTGKGDYEGTLTAEYVIYPKTITVEGLRAVDREYDGTTTVQLTADTAVLNGAVSGDDVQLNAQSVGTLYSPTARESKPVQIGAAQLMGAAASNYTLEPVDPVTVNIAKKTLTEDMFSIESVQYNGTYQTPAVAAADNAVIDGESVNLIDESDYVLTYAHNLHAGTASVTISADADEVDANGMVVGQIASNYTGSVTKTFIIESAPLAIKATEASSVYGEEIADVTNNYGISAGRIYTEEDRENLAIKAVTTVKKGYDAKVYKDAVTISYNKENTDYDVTCTAADYTITAAETLKVSSVGYTGVYDGEGHSIIVTPSPYRTDETVTVYYSTKAPLTKDNYSSTTADVGATTENPVFTDVGTYTVYYYAVSDNYTGIGGSETVTIAKAPLTVTAKEHTITYGDDPSAIADETIGAGVTIEGWKGNDGSVTLTGSVSYTSNDYSRYGDVGTYTLTPKFSDESGSVLKNYEISYRAGTLKVEPKKVTFTWTAAISFSYTGSMQGIAALVTGLVNGDAVMVGAYEEEAGTTAGVAGLDTLDRTLCHAATDAGLYKAKVKSLAGVKAANYTFDAEEATAGKDWEITKAENSWTINPSIQGWTEGRQSNDPVAAAKFGTVEFSYAVKPAEGEPEESDYSNEKPSAVGTYLMKASVPGGANYAGLTLETPVEFTISENPGEGEETKQTIYVIAQNKTITYGDTLSEITVSYQYADGTAVGEEIKNSLGGSLMYSTDYNTADSSCRNTGEYVLMPAGMTSETYNLVFKPGTLTVEPKEVVLFWSETELPYTGKEQSVTAEIAQDSREYGDNVYVSFHVDNTAVVVGDYTAKAITLSGTGADNYKLPENAEQSWKIIKAQNSFIIQPSIADWTYGETPSEPMASAKFGTVTFKYKENKEGIAGWSIFNPASSEVPTDAGEYVLIASVEAGEGYDELTSAETTFTIAPAQISVTARDASSSYGEETADTLYYDIKTLKGKITDADKEALEIKLSTEAGSGSAVGTYPITVIFKENTNINVTTVNGIYTISRAAMTAAAEDVSVVYDGKAHGILVKVTGADDKPVRDATIYYSTQPLDSQNFGNGSDTSPAITDAGDQTIYYYVTAENYNPVSGSAKVTVSQKPVTVTAKNAKISYGEEAVNAGIVCDGLIGSDTAESLGLTPSYRYLAVAEEGQAGAAYTPGSSVGTYQIIPGDLLLDGNYSYSYEPGTLTVAKKALSEDMFALSSVGLIYDGTEKEPVVTGTDKPEGTELLDPADYQVSYEKNVNAGENTAKAVITATEDGNYTGSVSLSFSILPSEVTVKAHSAASAYNEEISELTFEITSGTVLDADKESLNMKAETSVRKGYAVGVYENAVTVSYTKNNNYEITVVPADYEVTRALLTVTEQGYSGVYDGKEHKPALSVKTGKFLTFATIYYGTSTVDGTNYLDESKASTTCPSFKDAGIHTVYYYAICDNYEPVQGRVDVAITKAPLTVTVGNAEITYGESPSGAMSALTRESLSYDGLVAGDTTENAIKEGIVTFTTDYQQYGDAGEYQIKVSELESDNYVITCQPGILTVKPRQVTFTWPEITTFTYDGNEQGITATVDDTVNGDSVLAGTYRENTATAAGTYQAVVTGLSGVKAGNYTFDAEGDTTSKSWTIDKAANEWKISPVISGWTVGDQVNAPVAAAKYGTVTYSYSTEENGTYTAEIPGNAEAGTYYLKAEVSESANYTGLETIVSFEIKAAPGEGETEAVTVYVKADDRTGNSALTYGDEVPADFTYTLQDKEGNPAKDKDGNEITDLSAIADGTLSLKTDYEKGSKAGNYTVLPFGLTAKTGYEIVYQPGTITVNKKSIILNWSDDSFTYDGKEHTVTASVDSSALLYGDSIEVTGYETDTDNNVKNIATDAGTYTAHAISFSGKNASNYVVTSESAYHQWEIKKASSGEGGNGFVTEPSIEDWTYGDTPSVPFGEAKYGNICYTYSENEDGPYTDQMPVDAGSYYMKAVVEETGNYGGLSSNPFGFTIKQAKLTLIADDISSAYGENLNELTFVTNGKIKDGDDLGIRIATTATRTSKVGEYPITITHNNNDNYDITVVNGTYFITAISTKLQVTASGYAGTYDGQEHGITVTVKDPNGREVTDAVVYYSESELTESNYGSGSTVTPTLTDAGEKTVYYYVASDNYEPVKGSKEIVIEKKEVTVKVQNASITYGQEPANSGVVYSGFVGTDNETSLALAPAYEYTYARYQNAGNYQIRVQLADTENYHFVTQSGKLTVLQKPVTFKWSRDSFTYDGIAKLVTAEVLGMEGDDILTVGAYEENIAENIRNSALTVGNYTAKVIALAGEKADSYVIDQEEPTAAHTWTIQAGINYFVTTPSIESWTYGDTAPEPEGESAYGTVNFVYSTSRLGIYTAQKPVNAGSYYMKAQVEATEDYGMLESVPVAFQIKRVAVTVTAEDQFSKVGNPIKELTYTVTGKVVEGEKLEISSSTTATEDSPVGEYPITVSVDASENYQVTAEAGIYHIINLDLDITAEGVTTVYDGRYHGITVTAQKPEDSQAQNPVIYYSESRLPDTTDFATSQEASLTSPTRKDVGTTTVYYYVVSGETVMSGSKKITITKAPLTVKAKDATIFKGDEPANNGVICQGFVNGEDESYLSGTLYYSYSYTKWDADGSYTITPGGYMSANYEITFVPGILTVEPIQEEATIIGILPESGITYDGQQHIGYTGVPTAAGGAVTEFTYIYKDREGHVLTSPPVNAGSYTLTVSIPETNRYYKGSKTISFTIAKKAVIIEAEKQAMPEGNTFVASEPVYKGFIGDDNKDSSGKEGEAFAVKPVIEVYDSTGTKLDSLTDMTAGTYTLKIAEGYVLTDQASVNYRIAGTVDGELTVVAMPREDTPAEESGSSVKLDPDSPDSGTVQTAVIKEDSAPKAKLEANLTSEVAKKLLTEDEVQEVTQGANALIYLLWSKADDTASFEVKEAIEEKAAQIDSEMQIGMFLDVSLFKVVGDNAPVKISETTQTKVNIVVTLPDSLRNTNPDVERTYYIIYDHEGTVNVIIPVYADGTLSFDADKFSIYSIAYKDVVRSPGGGDNPGGSGTESGDSGSGSDKDHSGGGNQESGSEPADTNPVVKPSETPKATATPQAEKSDESGKKPENGKKENTSKPGEGKPAESGKDDADAESGKNAQSIKDVNTSKTDVDAKTSGTPEEGVEDQPGSKKAEPVDKVKKETQKQLSEALDKIREFDTEIASGPYIQIPETEKGDSLTKKGNVSFTLSVPEELKKPGRTYYLVAVDKDGNVIILQNESIEEGTLTFTGDVDLTYQLIYEDNGGLLSDIISEDGRLIDKNGKTITVKTNHCFWHFIILLLGIIGMILTLLFRKKKRTKFLIIGMDILFMIGCIILGWCRWDVILAVLCGILMFLITRLGRNSSEEAVE